MDPVLAERWLIYVVSAVVSRELQAFHCGHVIRTSAGFAFGAQLRHVKHWCLEAVYSELHAVLPIFRKEQFL